MSIRPRWILRLTATPFRGDRVPGAGPEEFDLIYAYPRPDEEEIVAETFEARARLGALQLT